MCPPGPRAARRGSGLCADFSFDATMALAGARDGRDQRPGDADESRCWRGGQARGWRGPARSLARLPLAAPMVGWAGAVDRASRAPGGAWWAAWVAAPWFEPPWPSLPSAR